MNSKDLTPTISLSNVCRSLKEEIFRVPFVNEAGERIFVSETRLSKTTLTVVLDNEQEFVLDIHKSNV